MLAETAEERILEDTVRKDVRDVVIIKSNFGWMQILNRINSTLSHTS